MGTSVPIFLIATYFCRESGIRTRDTLLEYTHFPGVLLQPLGHLSNSMLHYLYKRAGAKVIKSMLK